MDTRNGLRSREDEGHAGALLEGTRNGLRSRKDKLSVNKSLGLLSVYEKYDVLGTIFKRQKTPYAFLCVFALPQNIPSRMAILPSHKNGIEYLEHCSVRAADDQLVFVQRKDAIEQHFNIPGLNTAVLLLGPGTSMTQQTARLCAEGNVLAGFCGGGMAPVYLGAMNTYTEPHYSRNWIAMYQDEAKRLAVAKQFQFIRAEQVVKAWKQLPSIKLDPAPAADHFNAAVRVAASVDELLRAEAAFSKALYALLSRNFGSEFVRKPRSSSFANEFLDAGNYLAYGLAACSLWVLGIPHSYPGMHGKTRRGALVFDVADLVKDACIMPNAFISAGGGESASAARKRMLAFLDDRSALALMFSSMTSLAL